MIEYDPHEWFSHFWDVKGSMLRAIFPRVALCTALAACVAALWASRVPVAMPITIHSLVGVAIGLLLVFRTNSSYERFWEARRLWGQLTNTSRNFARIFHSIRPEAPDLADAGCAWIAAFPTALAQRLRAAPSDRASFDQSLNESEVEAVIVDNAARRGAITDIRRVYFESQIQLLIDILGGCERIQSTPLPFAYVVHLRRAVILYCATLPFGLVADFGWWSVVGTLFVSFVFFGIEDIGVEIENPFGDDDNDLPLERYCRTIARDVQSRVDPDVRN